MIGLEPPADLVSTETKSVVSIQPLEFDTDRANNARSVVQPVRSQANLWATLTADTSAPVAGTALTYTLVFGNVGPSAARAVRLKNSFSDSITTELTLTESLDWLPPGMTYTLTVPTKVDPGVDDGAVVTASVVITAETPDLSPDDNLAETRDTAFTRADLWVKTYVLPTSHPNYRTLYVIFGNYGPSHAHGVWVHNTLPPGVTATEPTSRRFDLVKGIDYGWFMPIRVENSAAAGVTLTNQALIYSLDLDPFTENNLSVATFVTPYQTFLPLLLSSQLD
jgi:uncharacterized repeat protein (TIGR01451 family)